jgi:hypothetical protein
MSQDENFDLQRRSGPEQSDHGVPGQPAEIVHRGDYRRFAANRQPFWVCGRDNGRQLPIAPPLPRLPRIPVMPRMETLDPSVRVIVLDLAALHDAAKSGAVPSLYRHLALWPSLLPELYDACARLMRDGVIPRGREALLVESHVISSRLLPALCPPGDFQTRQKTAALVALDTFTGSLIAEMTMVGLLLRAKRTARMPN